MQKTFLKFLVFELVERVGRFQLLLNESADILHERAPGLRQRLQHEAKGLEEKLLSHKTSLNRLFSEGGGKQASLSPDTILDDVYPRLCELSQVLARFKSLDVEPETFLFLKDVLPTELTHQAGEQSVFLVAEGETDALPNALFSDVLVDTLSVLQKNNPLGWLGLTQSFAQHLQASASSLESLKLELLKSEKKKQNPSVNEALLESLLQHAVNLRLLGPAYYFYALSDALFKRNDAFLLYIEPALFFGLNHQNFTHKSLVILHEACERFKPAKDESLIPLSDDALAILYRTIEKVVPTKFAFQAKHLERAIQLQARLSQGTLLSSSPLYPVEEVSEKLNKTRDRDDFSIYEPLSMLTEYPHTPREIINAGWLHKVERGPVWLYSALNEDEGQGFSRILELLDYQDSLLRKSIEVSEVHRVLLCSI